MKKDITHTIVIVIFTGILLGAGVLGVVFWRLQEQNKAQFTRYLMRISRFESLTLYKIQTTPDEPVCEDELHSIRHLTWDRETVNRLFSCVSWRRNDRSWANGWLAVVEFDDGSHKQLVMDPAGYFKIVGDSGYYQIRKSLRAEFAEMMAEICSGGIPESEADLNQ